MPSRNTSWLIFFVWIPERICPNYPPFWRIIPAKTLERISTLGDCVHFQENALLKKPFCVLWYSLHFFRNFIYWVISRCPKKDAVWFRFPAFYLSFPRTKLFLFCCFKVVILFKCLFSPGFVQFDCFYHPTLLALPPIYTMFISHFE